MRASDPGEDHRVSATAGKRQEAAQHTFCSKAAAVRTRRDASLSGSTHASTRSMPATSNAHDDAILTARVVIPRPRADGMSQ